MQQTVRTYSDLERCARAFADGHFEVFILLGGPGLEKTTVLRRAMGEADARWIEGTLSAFQLYCELWDHRNKPFVIDDVDNLYGDKSAVRLLKCVCQTEKVKTVGWHTNATKLAFEGIPREFATSSCVAIIANEWNNLNKNIGAVEDRGILLNFKPPAEEVHRRVAPWFRDEEILRFVGEHLHLVAEPSMRHYVNARKMKAAKLDWRAALLESFGLTPEKLVIARLKSDPSFASEEARVAEFIRQTGRSRATYFRFARKLSG